MLKLSKVNKFFGGLHAVDKVSIEIKKGSITWLIGPYGEGKTTLFNIISGHIKPSSGYLELDGEDITNMYAHELFSKGFPENFRKIIMFV